MPEKDDAVSVGCDCDCVSDSFPIFVTVEYNLF